MKEIIDDSYFKIANQEIFNEITSGQQLREESVQLPALNIEILRLVIPVSNRIIVGFIKNLSKIYWDQREIIDSRVGTYRQELIQRTNSLKEETSPLIEIPLIDFFVIKLKIDIHNEINSKFIHYDILIGSRDKSKEINWITGGLKQQRRGGKIERVRLLRMLHIHCLELASIIACFKPNEPIKIIQLNKEIGQAIYSLIEKNNYQLKASVKTYKLTSDMGRKYCSRCLFQVSKKDKLCPNCRYELS